MGAVTTRDELARKVAELKASGKKVVTTNGCFDLLHVGHVRFLKAARALGDALVVGMNTDASVRKLKGEKRPIQNENDRAEILSSLACVDFVCLFDEDTPVELLKVLKPNVHAKGADYKPSDLAETPVVESFGGRLEIIDLVPGRSTTNIVARMNS
ncbi:MAG TPA: D-glycero-beta-D-manno-heptose 1-phosphate adenylyltransferase [Oculatellaceae cyanobacterium]